MPLLNNYPDYSVELDVCRVKERINAEFQPGPNNKYQSHQSYLHKNIYRYTLLLIRSLDDKIKKEKNF